jgi:myosin protein heavy chain
MSSKNPTWTEYSKYMKYNKAPERIAGNEATRVWVPVMEEGKIMDFIVGEVVNEQGADYNLKTANGDQKLKKDLCPPMNPPKFEGSEDCAQLSHLNEPAVFANLRARYNADLIYTYSGLFTVAINPYKRIPIYTDGMINLYKGKKKTEIAPHIFAAADVAYRAMLNDRVNQSMLITGESGAGKTENTKRVIQYIAAIAGRASDGGAGQLESQLLEANPLMEAFGNAKTIKNDNSSRFGKFIKLQFNGAGNVSGATVNSYLLEKSRVIWQAKNERSFHIFYQLLEGTTPEQKKTLELGAPDTFRFPSHGQAWKVPSVNDVDDFKHTNVAMDVMGFTKDEKDQIFFHHLWHHAPRQHQL